MTAHADTGTTRPGRRPTVVRRPRIVHSRKADPVVAVAQSAAVLVFLFAVSGCGHHWHQLADPYGVGPLPSPIRLTTATGESLILYGPYIEGETITGYVSEKYDSVTPKRLSVSLTSVHRLEYGEPSVANRSRESVGLVIIIGTIFAYVAYVLVSLGGVDGS